MKPKLISPLLALSFLLLLGSCSTSHITMEVLKPADITLPEEVKSIALVNRFRPEKGKGFLNVLEGALTGEQIGMDRNGAEVSLEGLTYTLAGSPRFTTVRPNIELEGWGRAAFPQPIAPEQVKQICRDYNSQALVTIEAFDSDPTRSCEQRTREVKRDGETVTETYYIAHQWINVTVGWRMYSAETGTLMDEYRMQESVAFDAEGRSELAAYLQLPSKSRMVQEMGRVTGEAYSLRIAPIYLTVARDYYHKGSDALKAGRTRLRMDDWQAAEALWDQDLDHEKDKVRGRALFNKALAAEVHGDLETAKELAFAAYEKYGNKRARRYGLLLQSRIYDAQLLDEQMKGAE